MNNNQLSVNNNYFSEEHSSVISTEQKQQKLEVMQAFASGKLSLRSISTNHEANFLNDNKLNPRPVYLILPNIPVIMRNTQSTTLGIVNPQICVAYKSNAATDRLTDNITKIDELCVKCLADNKSLIEKMQEQSERTWEVYPYTTSGHLKPDGTFSLPKLKTNIKTTGVYDVYHSELLTVGYRKQQIKCYCISNKDTRNITDIVLAKQKLEKELGLAELPIAIYSSEHGSLEVFFAKELITNFKQLSINEKQFNTFSYSLDIEPNSMLHTINTLPITDKINTLQSAVLDVDVTKYQLVKAAVNMLSNPKNYSIAKLNQLIAQGLAVNTKTYHRSQYLSLADILIFTEFKSNTNGNDRKQALLLFEKLMSHGCSVSKISIVRINILKNMDNWIKIYFIVSNLVEDIGYIYLFNNMFANNGINFFILIKKLEKSSYDEIQLLFATICLEPLVSSFKPIAGECESEEHIIKLQMLFSYGANLPVLKEKIIAKLAALKIRKSVNYQSLYADKTPDEVFDSLMKVYTDYQTGKQYFDKQKILNIAEQELKKERARLNISATTDKIRSAPNIKNAETTEVNKLQFLVDAFKKPPVFNQLNNDDETITAILQHYYRRPGAERVIVSLYRQSHSDIWKKDHSSSHVIRAYNNIQWYMELLEKCNLACFNADEKKLLQLAIIYHDAAAEDVTKQDEEQQSATYFNRDMQGKFPSDLIQKVTIALESKENDRGYKNEEVQQIDERTRLYISVLRFADRMDFIRCADIDENFPNWDKHKTINDSFNAKLLDLPNSELEIFSTTTAEKTLFQRNLEAAMHGAADLASVTGGYYNDLRSKGNYATRYKLQINNNRLKLAFEYTTTPKTRIEQIIDNNVRRKIANLAGIHSCVDATPHTTCNADTTTGTMRGIHSSWLELQQVQVPKCMTLLEKMQCEHDLSLLSQTTIDALNIEVARLKTEGIHMSLGSLTQSTLKSPEAQKVLEQQGIKVVQEQRPRGHNENGQQVFEEVFTVYN